MTVAGALVLGLGGVAVSVNLTPSVKDDPLVRMPGSQPAPEGGVSLEAPDRCLNCHAGYNTAVEPGHNWMGSMMAQAARDFLFWACLTVAGQDSAWAIGRPNAVDICERCHFPKGWLEGRSDPPNGSAMQGADFDGVQCDFCHRMFDPFFEAAYAGTREGADWLWYWDETDASGTPSAPAALGTRDEDRILAQAIALFSGGAKDVPFYTNNLPPGGYTESGSGQYFVSSNTDKRASFADAAARHRMLYSRFHKSKHFCSTCHDVSNPVLANLGQDGTAPLTTETQSAFSYFHVERTSSEFMLSAYGQQGGAPGVGPFAPGSFETSLPGNYIGRCQDCHMRDVVGAGCDKAGVPIRPDQSVEHPQSGQPVHDLTGGNAWVSYVLASAIPGAANYDATNDALLHQGPAVLTLDLGQGLGVDPVALLDGSNRAKEQLRLAAAIEDLSYNASNGSLSFRVRNQTGHKLISGFPEGRRMFVNVKAYAGGALLYEVNPFDAQASTLKGLPYSYQPGMGLPPPEALSPGEVYVDELVYEMHPSSTLTGESESFHFALATDRYKDNRIPPKGFRIAEAAARIAHPRWHGEDAFDYFTAAEYAGGYDDVSLTIAAGADFVEVTLYYQTTSREYVEFLRDEINGNLNNRTLPDAAYIVQSDPFFASLKAWGNTIWELWLHNRNVDGAAPFAMTSATFGAEPPPPCAAPVPTLLSATPGNGSVTLAWSDVASGDPAVAGYRVYHDQSGKSQLVAELGVTTTFTETGLSNGQNYCYKVASYYDATCESGFSNVLCAVPNASGQLRAGVTLLETGQWVKVRGSSTFTLTTSFAAGDAIVIRAHVVDAATGLPLPGATVDLQLSGPEPGTLTTSPSLSNGVAEATWQTQAPNKRGQGGTPTGAYTATVTNVTASGYSWDGAMTSTDFDIQ